MEFTASKAVAKMRWDLGANRWCLGMALWNHRSLWWRGAVDATHKLRVSDTVTPMRYREVIRMPLWLLALIYFFLLSLVLSIWAALGDTTALVAFIAATVLMIFIALKTAMVIEVDDDELRVGRAHIAREYLGSPQSLTSEAVRALRTRDADPAAFLGIRFWSSTGVRVDILDSRDATPYWLITSNNGEKLVKALTSN
jgi:hypothetical protein